jgi:glycosyltransferase involved in cell wall biosynthesis
MLESGVWKSYDPRYLFQRYWEKKQKQLAKGLLPVAENYRQQLIKEGVTADRIVTVPCSVDMATFKYSEATRQLVRQRLGISSDAIVGIYVGKFGDIYYDAEAFDLFKAAADHFGPSFRLIILTPNILSEVRAKLTRVGFNEDEIFITKAPHVDVPGYLSAADFAFAPIKPAPCRLFCSPIKVGEYWAAGLPVLLTEGVGDDSAIIQQEGGGAIFNLDQSTSVPTAIQQVAELLRVPNYRQQTVMLAQRHRSLDRALQAYTHFFAPTQLITAAD